MCGVARIYDSIRYLKMFSILNNNRILTYFRMFWNIIILEEFLKFRKILNTLKYRKGIKMFFKSYLNIYFTKVIELFVVDRQGKC